jgi:hypothetical protein
MVELRMCLALTEPSVNIFAPMMPLFTIISPSVSISALLISSALSVFAFTL